MYRRLIFLISIVLVLGLVNSASAQLPRDLDWTGLGADDLWDTAGNWNPAGPPAAIDDATILPAPRQPLIEAGIDAVCNALYGPGASAYDESYLTITGGTLTVGGFWRMGEEFGSPTGTVYMSGGTVNVNGERMRISDEGTTVFNMGGGTINCDRLFIPHDTGSGTLNMNGGTIKCDSLEMNSDENPGSACIINLYGGTIECNQISNDPYLGGPEGPPSTTDVDFWEGELIIKGNVQDTIQEYIDEGWFKAYEGTGEVKYDYNGKNAGKTTVWGQRADVGLAWKPGPRNGVQNLHPDVVVGWAPGDYAEKHDVYFGTDFDDVNNANDPCTPPGRGRQDPNYYDPPGRLEFSQTYYWRIDEVNETDPCVWTGFVWSFTTNDGKAHSPSPRNNGTSVPTDANLVWSPGIAAAEHDVYFGTDYGSVRDANISYDPNGVYIDRRATCQYNPPGDLEPFITYYWRIDEVNDACAPYLWAGDVWNFMTSGGTLLHYKFDGTRGEDLPDSVIDFTGNVTFEKYVSEAGGSLTYGRSNPLVNPGRTSANFSPEAGLYNLDGGGILALDCPEYTIEMWIKPNSFYDDPMALFRKYRDTYILEIDADGTLDFDHAGGNTISSAPGSIVPRNWHHVAAVFDSGDPCEPQKLYINGIQVAGGGTTSLNPYNENFAGIGHMIRPDQEHHDFFDGLIDELRICDMALTPEEFLIRGDLALAWLPRPYSYATDVSRDVVLYWSPGDYVQDVNAHDVYFGTDYEAVKDANKSSVEYKGSRNIDANSYNPPGLLELGQKYYWRIDEVNDPCIWTGDVWRFTAVEFILVDDMEDYNDFKPDRIYDTWHDWSQYDPVGGKYPTSAEITIETADANVHGGEQSMKFQYNNSDSGAWMFYRNISEIDANTIGPLMYLEIGQDWTTFGVKALTLYFHGHAGNDANEQMYVALADSVGRTAVVPYGYYGEDTNDVKKREWTEWNIILQDFNDINDVNVADVNNVYIGFGNRYNPVVGGSGIVHFDDIRLYPPRCLPSYRSADLAAVDISGNCIVDLDDIEMMAGDWLESDEIVPVDAPDPCVAHYKFDEGDGNNIADSSDYGYDGTVVEGTPIWDANGKYDYCLDFQKQFGVEIPNGVFSTINTEITISVWVNGHADQNDVENVIFKAGVGAPPWLGNWDDIVKIETDWIDGELEFAAGDPQPDKLKFYAALEDWAGVWNHYAFVADTDSNFMGIYHNGRLVTEGTTNGGMSGITHAFIGIAPDNDDGGFHNEYIGKLDDFRIYDYALSPAEVAWLATDSTGVIPMRPSPANLYDEEAPGYKAVNFRDYAVLVDSWLDEELWPSP